MPPAGDMGMARELQAQFSRQGGGTGRSSRGRVGSRGPPLESQIPFRPAPACQTPAIRQPPGGSLWTGPLLTTTGQTRSQEPPVARQPRGGSGWTGPLLTTVNQARRPESSRPPSFAPSTSSNSASAPVSAEMPDTPYPTTSSGPPATVEDHPRTLFAHNDTQYSSPVAAGSNAPAIKKVQECYEPQPPLATSTNLVPTAPVFKPRNTSNSNLSMDSDYNPHLNGFSTSGGENEHAGTEGKIVQSGLASGRGLNSSRWA